MYSVTQSYTTMINFAANTMARCYDVTVDDAMVMIEDAITAAGTPKEAPAAGMYNPSKFAIAAMSENLPIVAEDRGVDIERLGDMPVALVFGITNMVDIRRGNHLVCARAVVELYRQLVERNLV